MRQQKYFILILSVVFGFTINNYLRIFTKDFLYHDSPSWATYQHLALRLYRVKQEIARHSEAYHCEPIMESWVQGLDFAIAQLDPKLSSDEAFNVLHLSSLLYQHKFSSVNSLINNQLMKQNLNNSSYFQRSNITTLYNFVCPEIIKINKSEDSYLPRIFQSDNCIDVPIFSDVLSVILSTRNWDQTRITFVVKLISNLYKVKIVLLRFDKYNILFDNKSVESIFFEESIGDGTAINEAILRINTPFTFISDSLMHFTEQCSLERLIRVLESNNELSVAAGSFRNDIGLWSHGCLQSKIQNYYLKYNKGYYYSTNDCMFCNDVIGPFVAKTETLRKYNFINDFIGAEMFHAWFLNIQIKGETVVSCPDVMFFVDQSYFMSRESWRHIAKYLKLQDITSHTGEDFNFSCLEIGIDCHNQQKEVEVFLNPPCCIKSRTAELQHFVDCADTFGLKYQLIVGSMLGLVKLDSFLPWDFDNDVRILCSDFDIWFDKGAKCLEHNNCFIRIITKTYFMIICPISSIDVVCRATLSKYLPTEYKNISTKIEVDGKLWNVMPNPGESSRNVYKQEYLRHTFHWRYQNSKDNYGMWKPCWDPGFHGCLDMLPADGSIPFKRIDKLKSNNILL